MKQPTAASRNNMSRIVKPVAEDPSKPFMVLAGLRLALGRKLVRMSMEVLCEKTSYYVTGLARVEAGTGNIRVDNLINLGLALNIQPNELLSPGDPEALRNEIAKFPKRMRPLGVSKPKLSSLKPSIVGMRGRTAFSFGAVTQPQKVSRARQVG